MKNKHGELGLRTILVIFVAIVVGIVFIVEIANTQEQVTNKMPITNETQSLVSCYTSIGQVNTSNSNCNKTVSEWYDSTDWRASHSSCNIGGVSVTNASGTALTATTDYNLYADIGVIQFLNTTSTNSSNLDGRAATNNSLMNYNFCEEGYNPDSGSRGIARLWTIFGAFIIVSAALYGIREWLNNR